MVLFLYHIFQCGQCEVPWCVSNLHSVEPLSTAAGSTLIPLSVSLWKDLADRVINLEGLVGFKNRWLCIFVWPKQLTPFLSSTVFPIHLFLSIGQYCGAGVF